MVVAMWVVGKRGDDWGGGIVVSDQKPVVEGDVWVCVPFFFVFCFVLFCFG